MTQRLWAALTCAVVLAAAAPAYAADSARTLFTRTMDQERTVRDTANDAKLQDIRRLVTSYERIVRRYPTSGFSDNALWQAANLCMLAADRFGDDADRRTATRLLTLLTTGYPSSRLVPQARDMLQRLKDATPAATTASPGAQASRSAPPEPKPAPTIGTPVLLSEIHRALLPDGVRVTLDLESEVAYRQVEVDGPRRVFFDLKGVKTSTALQDATLKYDEDVVKEIRLGRHPQNTVRVVLDLTGADAYSVYSLYNPYRLVVDVRRPAAVPSPPPPLVASLPATPPVKSVVAPPGRAVGASALKTPVPPPRLKDVEVDDEKAALPSRPSGMARVVPPAPPSANSNGKFSISRQLGLSVSRVVIDAGHGGHDPGAQGNGVNEAELTLDVALRLQKLLDKQAGMEVVMTRDSDTFIPLQERTAIANREGADLFLSIHANASRNAQARGVETYFLNFATNREAEAVAARENAGSGQTMHNLPDIVKAIALNNKINESRDFADIVQKSMMRRLSPRSKQIRDLGVKQAPFVVLIGAGMPSVLAEISFLTNKQEGSLLKTAAYRQQIAQALFEAVVSYQQDLKRMNAVAGKKATY
jgi:N-acetylmuramoyl-L-alanine amidase